VRVAVVQQSPCGDVASTTAHQLALVRRAADQGARLVVLPEGGLTGLPRRHTEAVAAAQPLDGAYVATVGEAAAALRVAVVVNFCEPATVGGRTVVYNTTAVLEAGEIARTYRKVHLFDAQGYCESASIEPGDPAQLSASPLVLDGVAVALATCFDLRFAELAVAVARRGAELLAVPAAWVAGPHKRGQWEVLLRARAIETGCYLAGAAQPGPQFTGGSGIYGPDGVPVAAVLGDDGEGVVVADVDPRVVARARATTPTLRHRPVWDAR